MVMVAERNDAGMRRRARRDQNDREEKAETMRRESGTNLDFLSGARGRGAPPLPRAILADYIRAGQSTNTSTKTAGTCYMDIGHGFRRGRP